MYRSNDKPVKNNKMCDKTLNTICAHTRAHFSIGFNFMFYNKYFDKISSSFFFCCLSSHFWGFVFFPFFDFSYILFVSFVQFFITFSLEHDSQQQQMKWSILPSHFSSSFCFLCTYLSTVTMLGWDCFRHSHPNNNLLVISHVFIGHAHFCFSFFLFFFPFPTHRQRYCRFNHARKWNFFG